MEAKTTSALAPKRGRIVRRSFENLYDWIGNVHPQNQKQSKAISSPGGEGRGEGGRNTYSNENVDGMAATRLYAVFFCG